MAVTMPRLDIIFKKLATSLIERSERGYAILIIRDNTSAMFNYKEYTDITELETDSSLYTAENLQYLRDIFAFAPYRVCVVKIGIEATISEALIILEGNVKTGWVTVASGTTEDFATLASWTKSKENSKKYYKSVCYKAATTDCKHIVNFYNSKVTFNDSRGEVTGEHYCPSIIGILAVCNIARAATNYVCSNLSHVDEVVDNDAAVGNGQFILVNDVDTVKIGLGINSLTTTNGTTLTEDMKYIDIVEAMDLINDDISDTFKTYQGAYKNKYDNQVLFINSVNGYFKNIAEEDVLDINYTNKADVNVEAQRAAWIAAGKSEAVSWNEATVKNNTFKRSVFLAGDIKILGAMENLAFNISLF